LKRFDHNIYGGFPLKSLLSPYKTRFNAQSRREWWTTSGNKICKVNMQSHRTSGKARLGCTLRPQRERICRGGQENSRFVRIFMVGGRGCSIRTEKSSKPGAGRYMSSLPIADLIQRLLSGETSVNEVRDDWERQPISTRNAPVQATLWLTLFMLDARIQSLWCQIDPNCHINECRHWLIEETRMSNVASEATKWRLRRIFNNIPP
jgi:hypothetical protein